ncbi:hypothetical protein AAC387_Pa02g3479 [Persea americana]
MGLCSIKITASASGQPSISRPPPQERKSASFVRWEKVCLPKSEGGLGLRRVRDFNEACLLNLAWTVVSADSLWAIWFRARYIKGPSIWHSSNSRNGSCIWKKLSSLSTFLQGDSRWVAGNVKSINLWFDNWIDHFSIASRFPYIQFSDLDLVAEIIVDNAWLIPIQLPMQLHDFLAISTVPISIGDNTSSDILSILEGQLFREFQP